MPGEISQPKHDALRRALEITFFVAIVVANAYELIPITPTIFLLALIWVVLRLGGEHWNAIGFARPSRLGWSIAVGTLAGVLMELFAVYLTTPLISSYFGVEPDYSSFKVISGNAAMLLLFVGVSWALAAFGEEICFRGFLMTRLAF